MNTNTKVDPILRADPATDHILGSAAAPVTVIEYGDFECPTCRQAYPAVKIMLGHFGNKVRFVFRHFPLREVHLHAELAAEATEAAGAQHQFWPYYDLLFAHQQHIRPEDLTRYAQQLGLDMPRFGYEMKDNVYLQRVQEQVAGAERLGVRTTPAFYVNGVFCDVSFGLQHLHQAIDQALA